MVGPDPSAIFGAKLRQRRREVGMSQADLAKRMGTTQAYISRAERGLENPPILTCVAFALQLGRTFKFDIT